MSKSNLKFQHVLVASESFDMLSSTLSDTKIWNQVSNAEFEETRGFNLFTSNLIISSKINTGALNEV